MQIDENKSFLWKSNLGSKIFKMTTPPSQCSDLETDLSIYLLRYLSIYSLWQESPVGKIYSLRRSINSLPCSAFDSNMVYTPDIMLYGKHTQNIWQNCPCSGMTTHYSVPYIVERGPCTRTLYNVGPVHCTVFRTLYTVQCTVTPVKSSYYSTVYLINYLYINQNITPELAAVNYKLTNLS